MTSSARYWRADGGYQDAPNSQSPAAAEHQSCKPARYWRADGGYQDVTLTAAPPPPYAATARPDMFFFPPGAQWCVQQPYFLNMPIGIQGVCSPPPAYSPLSLRLTPRPPTGEKEEGQEEEEKKEKKVILYAPPKVDKETIYMFDKPGNHTMLHIFNKGAPVWEEKYKKEKL